MFDYEEFKANAIRNVRALGFANNKTIFARINDELSKLPIDITNDVRSNLKNGMWNACMDLSTDVWQ